MWSLILAAATAAVLCVIGTTSTVPKPYLAPLRPLKENEKTIAQEYIIVFKEAATEFDVGNHMDYLNNMILAESNDTFKVQHVYHMGPKFRGYAATMHDKMLESVRGMQEVEFVERNQWGEFDQLEESREKLEKYLEELEDSDYLDDDDNEDHDDEDDYDDDDVESKDPELGDLEKDLENLEESDEDAEWDQWGEKKKRKECRKRRLHITNWALSRISHKWMQRRRLNYRYNKHALGKGVNIYIIDSGIDVKNSNFGGRARWGTEVFGGLEIDTTGHGTAVAGCAISNTYGVARKATAIAVGIGFLKNPTTALAIAGFDWVLKNHKKGKSIVNASFRVDDGEALLRSVDTLVDAGVPVVVSAGNENKDACKYVPAKSRKAITVGSTNRFDEFSSSSNFGECVDILAPGECIRTLGKDNRKNVLLAGTSFAAPYTSGVLATILGQKKFMKPAQAVRILKRRALRGKIRKVPRRTPNHLLNSIC